jgi:hypothetical protein
MKLAHVLLLASLLLPQAIRVALADEHGGRTGSEWLLDSKLERLQWIDGFRQGAWMAFQRVPRSCYAEMPQYCRDQAHGGVDLSIPFTNGGIEGVMTNLYQDPANRLIEWRHMLLIARDKLRGENIEPTLRAARLSAAESLKGSRSDEPKPPQR